MKLVKLSGAVLLTLACSHSLADELKQNLNLYISAWNELDDAKRIQILEQATTVDMKYFDPSTVDANTSVNDQQVLSDWISSYHDDMYDFGLSPTYGEFVTALDVIGNEGEERTFRIDWKITAFSGSVLVGAGLDIGTANAEGKITSISAFYNQLTPLCQAAAWQVDAVYLSDNQVTYNEHTYQANWWTNNAPDSELSIANGEWKDLGVCATEI